MSTPGVDMPFKFLGCTVVQISSNLGINGQPTTVDVRMIEDISAGDVFLADTYAAPTASGQEAVSIKTAVGGTFYTDGNPGTFAILEAGSFKFGGIVTNYKRSGSTSGRFIDVQLSDPRILLKEYPVVMEFDINLYTDQTPGSTWDYNVFNPLRDSNALNEDITASGIRFFKIKNGIEDLSVQFFGTTYKIKFDTSFKKYITGNYRIPIQNTNLEQVISRTAEDNSMDWYAECITEVKASKEIIIYGINRRNQYVSSSSALNTFIADQQNVINFEIGRELRTDASQTVVYGDKVRTLSLITPGSVFPVFAERADGSFSDDGFVDLSGIVSDDLTILEGLPVISISKTQNTKILGSLITDPDEHAAYYNNPTYTKGRTNTSRRGYYINEFIARAALHSKAAWTTAVWYFYKDGGAIARANRTGFDVSWTANSITQTSINGASDPETGTFSLTTLPEALGIYAPDFDRDNLSFTSLPVSSSTVATPYTEALKEACYQATLTMADSYYGKVFIGILDHHSTIAQQVANTSGGYSYSSKALPMEFNIASSAPNIMNINGVTQAIPPIISMSQNSAFNEDNGLIKPFMLTRLDQLRANYDRVNISNFDSATSLKLASANAFVEVSTVNATNLCDSSVSINSYKFDPRLVVATVNEPVYLDYGLIRWFKYGAGDIYNITDVDVIAEPALCGQIKNIALPASNYLPNAYSASNKSGGTQEFLSWLYRDYTIMYNTSSAILVNGCYVDIDKASTSITASKYDQLMTTFADAYKDQIGFDQRRNINEVASVNLYVPLVWKYVKYGPFTSPDSVKDVPTQFIEDSSINPWSYGSIVTMNDAGKIIAQNASAKSRTLGYASVSVHGLPQHQLGKTISDGEANIANISELSISVGAGGSTTSYRLRTFFGAAGIRKKVEVDRVSRSSNSAQQSKKGTIKLDDIVQNMIPKGSKLSTFSKPFYAAGSSSNTVLTSAGRAGNSGKSEVSLTADNAPKLADENGAGTNPLVAFSSLSELFQPVTAQSNQTNGLIAPTIQGIRIN